jgi:hypothetical protein
VSSLRIYFPFGAEAIAIGGAWAGILPGTAIKKPKRKRKS